MLVNHRKVPPNRSGRKAPSRKLNLWKRPWSGQKCVWLRSNLKIPLNTKCIWLEPLVLSNFLNPSLLRRWRICRMMKVLSSLRAIPSHSLNPTIRVRLSRLRLLRAMSQIHRFLIKKPTMLSMNIRNRLLSSLILLKIRTKWWRSHQVNSRLKIVKRCRSLYTAQCPSTKSKLISKTTKTMSLRKRN